MKKIILITLLALAILLPDAWAVTYRNDSSEVIAVPNSDGRTVYLDAGDTITTQHYVDLTKPEYTGLTKVNDYIAGTSYYNPTLSHTEGTASSSGVSVSVNLEANWYSLMVLSGTISIFAQSTSNTPAMFSDWTEDRGYISMPLYGYFDTFVITGTGTFVLDQYKLPVKN